MVCGCDSGLVIVVFITSCLLCCVAWLLLGDFSGPCEQHFGNSEVGTHSAIRTLDFKTTYIETPGLVLYLLRITCSLGLRLVQYVQLQIF